MKFILALMFLLPALALAQDYNRSDWNHWEDFDRDCQNTRHELLIAQSLVEVTYTSDSRCYVATGAWQGPYTGKVFTSASEVQIDHVIALRYAHEYGGATWSPLLKKVFANDPDNLLISEARENQSKGWRGPSNYMPPIPRFHCEYARIWLHLVRKYELQIAVIDALVISATVKRC